MRTGCPRTATGSERDLATTQFARRLLAEASGASLCRKTASWVQPEPVGAPRVGGGRGLTKQDAGGREEKIAAPERRTNQRALNNAYRDMLSVV